MAHPYELKASWKGGLNGDGKISVGNLQSPISVPKDMQGPGKGTNPEELVVGAASTCYLITLAAILERRKVPVQTLELSSEGTFTTEGGLKFAALVHRPRVVLAPEATEEVIQTVRAATERAETACMISNALRGNVKVTIEAAISK